MTGIGPAGRTQRFRELDGLRGIAASAVVVYHLLGGYDGKFPDEPASQWTFHWGAYGVQLFFMISGFVILMSARRAQRPVDFVISRVSRLYPAYWLAMAGTLLLAWGFGIYAAIHRPTVGEALANLTMVQRWLLVENVDQVYWTLAVEMQFYAVVFALLVLSRCTLTLIAGCCPTPSRCRSSPRESPGRSRRARTTWSSWLPTRTRGWPGSSCSIGTDRPGPAPRGSTCWLGWRR